MSEERKYPKRFVGLHGHTTASTGDAIGTVQDHVDFVLENGGDALAITDHGNMNHFSYQYLYSKDLKAKGRKFKAISGVEAYIIPSLKNWQKLYDNEQDRKAEEKAEKRREEFDKKIDTLLKKGLKPKKEKKEVVDEDTQGGTQVEDENASKRQRFKNPLYQRSHLVLLPKNSAGLKTLFKCVSHSFVHGFYKFPRMDFELLAKEANGNIIASTACVAGPLARVVFDHQEGDDFELWQPNDHRKSEIDEKLDVLIHRFQEIFGPENFNLELQFNRLSAQHLVNYYLLDAAKRNNVPLITTVDSHYSNPDHWKERVIYVHMARQAFMKDEELKLPESVDELKCELYPKNAIQAWDTYLETSKNYDFYDDNIVRDSMERTYDIAHDQIGEIDLDRSAKLPSIKRLVEESELERLIGEVGPGADEDALAFEELKKLTIEGARWRKVHENQEYIQRLRTELEVVKHLKFSKYFLTYHQIMKVVGEHCLTGPGRGSAAGSMLAYVLDITQIDPIKNGLLFERFLVKSKKGWPDIDSDFSDRDKARELLSKYFGEENVIPVSNFNQLQMRSLIKDICRLNGVDFKEANAATKKIEAETKAAARRESGFDATQWFLSFEAAMEDSPTFRGLIKKYPDFAKHIKVLFKNNRSISRHAGGIIISENPAEHMPLIKARGVLQTPWAEGANYRHLEPFGFLKFDILALGTLRMFENCIRRILKKQGNKYPTFKQVKEFYYNKLHPDNNDMTDMKVYKNVYWKSNYAGIFQFVNPQVQKMMKKMKPRCIGDIAILTSLFRPGPLSIQADKIFMQNRKEPDSVVYKHPLLKEVFHDTSGILVFQEQLQIIYNKLAGVPLEETDDVRKAFTKKEVGNIDKQIAERNRLRNDFIEKCRTSNDISEEVSASIFDDMEKYTKYSFNKSHAVSYATISFQCAWLLTYHKDEWIEAYVDYCTEEKGKASGYEDPKAVALSEAKTLGYDIGKADINKSEREFRIIDNVLIPSFGSTKSVGVAAQNEIYQFRPYKTLEDLLWNSDDTWRHSKFNKRSLAALICMEALESMELVGPNKLFKNYKQLHHVVVDNHDALKRAITRKSQDHKEVLEELVTEAQLIEDWTMREKIVFSKEIAGSVDLGLIMTPEIRTFLKESNIESVDSVPNGKSDKKTLFWGIVESQAIAFTKNGKKYRKIKLYGDSGVSYMCFQWGFSEERSEPLREYGIVLGKFDKSDFGLSSFKLDMLT